MLIETGIRVALLGPLLVDGRPWAARSAAWRRILAALALKTGVLVSYGTLIETAGLDRTSKDPKKALQTSVARLQARLGLQAIKDRIRAVIHLGHHESVIPELGTRTRTYPTEELFWALLMLAQYRSGSRPAAKRTYEAARDSIRQELDLDPGETIERMHAQIRGLVPAPEIPVP